MKDDRLYLIHIGECIDRIESYTRGMAKEAFLASSLVQGVGMTRSSLGTDRGEGRSGVSYGLCLTVLVGVCLSTIGCDRDPARERDIQGLKQLSQKAYLPPDVRERIDTVIAKCQDRVRDPEPILIMATLVKGEGVEKWDFALWVFDEDKDLSGFLVRELSHGANGTTTVLEERYPAFVHLTPTWIATAYERYSVPIHIRDTHQRKDEGQWTDYLSMDLGKLVKEKLPNTSLPDFWYNFWNLWADTLPLAWVSLPEPNQVDVSFYVYDKAGHKSNTVKPLVNSQKLPGKASGEF